MCIGSFVSRPYTTVQFLIDTASDQKLDGGKAREQLIKASIEALYCYCAEMHGLVDPVACSWELGYHTLATYL